MRADLYLVNAGLVASRERAKKLIASGLVCCDGKVLTKPSDEIAPGEHDWKISDPQKYVGRGGEKLEAALTAFGIRAEGKVALDIGASTGGFTDCLLQRGAVYVYAVDVGTGQLAKKLRDDPRVISIEHCNARELTSRMLGERVDLIAMDVSFISATYILPRFPELLKESGEAVCLVKPQFEVGRERLCKGGIVKEPAARADAIRRVADAGRAAGLFPIGLICSPITGGDGNVEFLIHFTKHLDPRPVLVDEQRIKEVTDNRKEGEQC